MLTFHERVQRQVRDLQTSREALTHPQHVGRWLDFLAAKRGDVAFTLFGGVDLEMKAIVSFVLAQSFSILVAVSGGGTNSM